MFKTLNENKKLKRFLLIFFLVAIVVFSYLRTLKENEAGDFHVFYLAGKTLFNKGDIYFVPPGLRNFIYPPFAALFLMPLSFLPFKVATFIFFVSNFGFVGASFYVLKKILDIQFEDRLVAKSALLFSMITSFKLCWNNIMMIQTNQLVFLLTLLGIYYFLKKRENLSIAFFCLAISLKVFPILFAFWVIARGSRGAILKFVLGGLICIALPMLFSGFSFGIEQLDWYLHNFILKVTSAEAMNLTYANQSLTGTLGRMFTSLQVSGEPLYTIIDLGFEKTKSIISISKLIIFISMLSVLLISRFKKMKISLFEPAIIFVTIHLISGVTWKAHLVSFSFVFAVVGADVWKRLRNWNPFDYLIITYFLLIAVLGQVIVGKKGQLYMNGWGDYTLVMLLSLVFLIYSFIRDVRELKVEN